MAKRVGILRFLGTNCDRDVWQAVESLDLEPRWLWHADRFEPNDYQAFVVPGGFSYGDYLRCGALAAKSPVMESLREAAKHGFPVLGICNGFQILCESRLLPGALVRNAGLRFKDQWVDLKLVNSTAWTASSLKSGASVRLPIAHGEGRFFADDVELERIWQNDQVWFTYSENPNGSLRDIAGVCNAVKNVCALMPHPERAIFDWMGGEDGREILSALL
jgi:phosphoribosylformylglycinamidine synthase I